MPGRGRGGSFIPPGPGIAPCRRCRCADRGLRQTRIRAVPATALAASLPGRPSHTTDLVLEKRPCALCAQSPVALGVATFMEYTPVSCSWAAVGHPLLPGMRTPGDRPPTGKYPVPHTSASRRAGLPTRRGRPPGTPTPSWHSNPVGPAADWEVPCSPHVGVPAPGVPDSHGSTHFPVHQRSGRRGENF